MKLFLRLFPVAVLISLTTFVTAAPDLSGQWKLNTSKSEFGPAPAPSAAGYTISQHRSTLTIDWQWSGPNGEMGGQSSYSTDGGRSVNNFNELELTTVAHWEGDVLHMDSEGNLMGTEMEFADTWELTGSDELTIRRLITSSMGEMEQVLVFDRVK